MCSHLIRAPTLLQVVNALACFELECTQQRQRVEQQPALWHHCGLLLLHLLRLPVESLLLLVLLRLQLDNGAGEETIVKCEAIVRHQHHPGARRGVCRHKRAQLAPRAWQGRHARRAQRRVGDACTACMPAAQRIRHSTGWD